MARFARVPDPGLGSRLRSHVVIVIELSILAQEAWPASFSRDKIALNIADVFVRTSPMFSRENVADVFV